MEIYGKSQEYSAALKFTLSDQLLSRNQDGSAVDTFYVGIKTAEKTTVTTYFKKDKLSGFDIAQTIYNGKRFYSGMSESMIQAIWPEDVNPAIFEPLQNLSASISFGLAKTRGFLYPYIHAEGYYRYFRLNRHHEDSRPNCSPGSPSWMQKPG